MINSKLADEISLIIKTNNDLIKLKEQTKGKTGKEFKTILRNFKDDVIDYEKIKDKVENTHEIEGVVIDYLEYYFKHEKYLSYEFGDEFNLNSFNDLVDVEMRAVIRILIEYRRSQLEYDFPSISRGNFGGLNAIFGYNNVEYIYCVNLYSEDIFLVNEELKGNLLGDDEELHGISGTLNNVKYYYDLKEHTILKRKGV